MTTIIRFILWLASALSLSALAERVATQDF